MKTGCWANTDADARKPGEQTGLDTPVVLALNDEYLVSGVLMLRVPSLTFLVFRLGSTLARVKLKGIDGDSHKQWSMWFNSIQRVEPYQGLTCSAKLWKHSGGYPDTGAAWPSSVRAVRCMVKSYNERNPWA